MLMQLTLAARYLSGRRLRTGLTTLAVAFGVLVLFGMNIILPTMLAALQANALAASGQVDLTVTHAAGGAFPQAMLDRVLSVAGVRAASASLKRTVTLPVDFYDHDPRQPDRVTALALVGVDPLAARTVRAYPVTAGRFLAPADAAAAVISQSLADALGVSVGGTFIVPAANGAVTLIVAGLLPARFQPGNEEVLVTLPQAQRMAAEPGRINAIEVNLDPANEAQRAALTRAVEAVLGADYQVGALFSGAEMFASLQLGQAAFSLFGVLALFMGAFIIFNTFRTVVAERRRDLGLLRAVGASRGTLVGMILCEGLLQGISGTAVGLLAGYLLGAGILRLAEPLMSQFINLKIGPPVVSPAILAVSIALGVGTTVISGLVPAVQASRVTPLEALRPGAAEVEFRRQTGRGLAAGGTLMGLGLLALLSRNAAWLGPGVLLFLAGLVFAAPALVQPLARAGGWLLSTVYARGVTGDLARGNLTRAPARAAVTASATMLGLAVVVAAGGLVSSLSLTVLDVMRKSLGSDYLFVPPSVGVWASNVGANASLAQSLRALDAVQQVSTLRFAPATVNGQAVSLMGIDPAAFPEVSGLHFLQGSAAAYRDLAAGRALIANGAFLAATGARLGDTVEIVTSRGRVPYRVAAVGSDMLNVKITTAFVSQADLLADFGTTEDVFLQLNLRPGADAARADAQIRAAAADFPQFRIIAGKAYYAVLRTQLMAAYSGIYLLLALLALPSLIAMLNTLAIGVIERTREIGMLRAVGATRPQVRAMVVAEALLLAALGAFFGVLAGLYLGYVFVRALETLFPLGYAFPAAGIVAAAAIGLLFGAAAAIIPARQAARLEIIHALRYE
jgi:putative ABC transport system permease protein